MTAGPDTEWHASGDRVQGIPTGTHSVEFAPSFAFITPSNATVVVTRDEQTDLHMKYQIPDMVPVPGGTFMMGNVQGRGGCPVTVSDFYIDTREVTIAEYQAYCSATGAEMPVQPWPDPQLPVVNVSFRDARRYAAWRGKRLPTEAEWEYASRGGLADALYPWGDTISPSDANYDVNVGHTTKAGTYVANGFAVFDTGGNVREWNHDWYAEAISCNATNPIGPASGTERVMRGGSWASYAHYLECASRSSLTPMDTFTDLGFRCAMYPPEVSLGAAAYEVGEADSGMEVPVALSAPPPEAVTVAFHLAEGTARAGDDYVGTNGLLHWSAGDVSTQYISVSVLDDVVDEFDETLTLTLSEPVHALLGAPSTGQITIVDEDPLPGLVLDGVPLTVPEDGGTAWVSVLLTAPSEKEITVDFATSDGTALAGEDYAQTNGVLGWRESKGTNRTFAIPIVDDQLFEGNETLLVTILNPVNAVISGAASRHLTILDDEQVEGFAIICVREDASGQYCVLEWESVQGATYSVDCTEDLHEPFTRLKVGIVATPPVNVFVDTRPHAHRRFYRIRAH
jgi:hypothetical protein